jgi:hypothetical protein
MGTGKAPALFRRRRAAARSRGSRTTDRLTKPAVYARAGITSFWRVELEDGPAIFAYRLALGDLRRGWISSPWERLVLNEPFPCSLDPGDLRS